MRPGTVDLANLPRDVVLYEAAITAILEAHDAAVHEVLSRRRPGGEAEIVRLVQLQLDPADPDYVVVSAAIERAAWRSR